MTNIDYIDDVDIRNHIIVYIEVTCKIIQKFISEPSSKDVIEMMKFIDGIETYKYKNYRVVLVLNDYRDTPKIYKVGLEFSIIKDGDWKDWKNSDVIHIINRKVYTISKERMIKIERLKLL
jgi:hypothetical protein